MGLHTELAIYRTCYDLLGAAVEGIRNMRRDIKSAIGQRIIDACIELELHIRRANMATEKEPHILALLERLEVIELLVRLCRDRQYLPTAHYARVVGFTQSIGKQANGWRRQQGGGHTGQRQLFDRVQDAGGDHYRA